MFYGEDGYRSSDHDPVIVDLDLNGKDSNQPNDNQKSPIFDFLSQLMEWISQLLNVVNDKMRDVNVFYHILNNRHARQLARENFFKNIR